MLGAGISQHAGSTIPALENAALTVTICFRPCQAANNLLLPTVHSPTKRTYLCASQNRILLLILQEKRSAREKCFELLLLFPVIYWHSYSCECIETGGNWGSDHSSHHLCSNESRHKNAGHKKSDQVMLSTSMLKQIQKSEKSNIKVKIM